MLHQLLSRPQLGFGVGLRSAHFAHVLNHDPAVDWFEVISENFLDSQGRPRYVLDQVAERFPIVMHGVSLSIGSSDPLDRAYLGKLKSLARAVNARWVSDHLCWTGVLGRNTHDLLPLPLNEDTLAYVTQRVRDVQEILERPLVLENPSTYVTFTTSTLSEAEFLTRLAADADCGLLLDVNNVYVSSVNHDFDPWDYVNRIPPQRVVQFHLAGHTNRTTHLLDTHDGPVADPVWELYRAAARRAPHAATLLEWDAQLPAFGVLEAELAKAQQWRRGDALPAKTSADAVPQGEDSAAAAGVYHPLHWIAPEVADA